MLFASQRGSTFPQSFLSLRLYIINAAWPVCQAACLHFALKHSRAPRFSATISVYIHAAVLIFFSLSLLLLSSCLIESPPSTGRPTLICDLRERRQVSFPFFKKKVISQRQPPPPLGLLGEIKTLKMSKELSFCPLLSSLASFPLFCFLLLSLCPHISATLRPCRRSHCKCHVENEGRVIVCAWGGLSLLLEEL